MNKRQGKVAAGLAGSLLVLVLGTAGCSSGSSGPGVAGAGTGTGKAPGSTASGSGDAVAYSRCMRAHGLPKFPDPDSNGAITITGGPGDGLGPDSAAFKAAQQACASLSPKSGGGAPQIDRNATVNYAKCMRQQGITKFPDPDAQGGIKLNGNEINQNTPQYKAAAAACAKFMPGGGGGHMATSGTGAGG